MRGSRLMIFAAALLVPAASAPAAQAPPPPAAAAKPVRPAALGPAVDHHQHLMSPAAAELLGQAGGGSAEVVTLPAEMRELLARRTAGWNDAAALAQIYTDDAILVENSAVTGGKAVAELVSGRFASPYAITPIGYAAGPSHRTIAAMYTRGEGAERKNVGLTLIGAEKDKSGRWRIASESMKFPGPVPVQSLGAETLVELLDQAQIDRAVVMSVAYFFESPFLPKRPDSPARLRAENDWTAAEVGKHPARLLGFCSVNPLTDQALAEMERCTQLGGPERVLYGSDGAFAGNPPPDESWGQFRGMVPLTDAEFAVIRDNLAPYLR